eukprot:gb/GFBE01000653.1/.p1 GENE.gb/GFBE01000653.1/~~gb/GFBE01000653.1/.p1  ORF type:complete len:254 (+),score=45.28 gb/GFBE01000653.1/:1-762(+)
MGLPCLPTSRMYTALLFLYPWASVAIQLPLQDCQWVSTHVGVEIDNRMLGYPARFAIDDDESTYAVYLTGAKNPSLAFQCKIVAPASVYMISFDSEGANEIPCPNGVGKLPSSVDVTRVQLGKEPLKFDWSASTDLKSPVHTFSDSLVSYVTISVDMKGACSDFAAYINQVAVYGDIKDWPCMGSLATGKLGSIAQSKTPYQCDGQDLSQCDQTYTRTTSGKYIQCGVSSNNCLTLGPLCKPNAEASNQTAAA